MSVVSRNPFDLLADGDSPAPAAPVTKPTPAAAAKAAEPAAPAKEVPGSKPGRGRGQGYYSRGGPRNVLKGSPASPASPAAEDPESGFDGERRSPGSNDLNNRGTRPSRGRGGGDRRGRGARRGAGEGGHFRGPHGGDRGHGDRRSHHALPDTEKKIASGWGDNEGETELAAEVDGAKDASAEAATPVEGEAAEAAPAEPTPEDEAKAAARLAEEEEAKFKSYDDYLAEKTKAALSGDLGKLEGRKVEGLDDFVGSALQKAKEEEWFSGAGKKEAKSDKVKAPKKEKVFIDIEGRFAPPAGSERGDRGGRGGRGAARGSRGGDRGSARGAGRGARGAPRAPKAAQGPSLDDTTAFPALGA